MDETLRPTSKKIRISFDSSDKNAWKVVDQVREAGMEVIPTFVRGLTSPVLEANRPIRGASNILSTLRVSSDTRT